MFDETSGDIILQNYVLLIYKGIIFVVYTVVLSTHNIIMSNKMSRIP